MNAPADLDKSMYPTLHCVLNTFILVLFCKILRNITDLDFIQYRKLSEHAPKKFMDTRCVVSSL